jgi:hypothetical protein
MVDHGEKSVDHVSFSSPIQFAKCQYIKTREFSRKSQLQTDNSFNKFFQDFFASSSSSHLFSTSSLPFRNAIHIQCRHAFCSYCWCNGCPSSQYRVQLPCVLYIDCSIVAREAEALPEAAPAELEARLCNCIGCMPC